MARIYTKTSKEAIIISDDKAKKLAQLKSDYENKLIEDSWIDTELWAGALSQIRGIEIEPERKYSEIRHEKSDQHSIEKMHEARKNLERMGIIKT